MKKKPIIFLLGVIILLPVLVLNFIGQTGIIPASQPETALEEEKQQAYKVRELDERYNYEPGEFDKEFTNDNEFLYKNKVYKLIEYKDKNLYASNFVERKYDDYTAQVYSGDDPIVNIVPRELFNCRGDYLYVGKEYGFFVKTEAAENYSNNVTVIVFDVIQTKLNDDPGNPDSVSSKVEVLFQYTYKFLTRNNELTRIWPEENLFDNTLIIATKTSIWEGWNPRWFFGESDRFALSNISFQKDLINEQHPDRYLDFGVYPTINKNYIANNDMGNFITRADYSFKGANEVKPIDLATHLRIIIGNTVGFIPAAGNLYGVVDSSIAMYQSATSTPVSYDGRLGAQCFYTTKPDQITHYGGLNKSALVILPAAIAPKILLFQNSGQNAKAEFTLSRNAKWHTKVKNTVYMSVVEKVKEDWDEKFVEVTSNYGTYIDHADKEEEYKPADVSVRNSVTVLPDGNDYYSFRAPYSGYYAFKTTASKSTEIELMDSDKNKITINNGKDNDVKYLLKGGIEYKVRVASTDKSTYDSFEFWVEFSPEQLKPGIDNGKGFTIPADGYTFYEFKPDMSAPFMIKTAENLTLNVLDEYLQPILNYDGSINWDYRSSIGEINALFKNNLSQRYYVQIYGSAGTQSTIAAFAPTGIELNKTKETYLNSGNAIYYSFKPEYSGNYKFNSSNCSALSLYSDTLFLLKNSNVNYLEYFLMEGQTYYFKLNKGYDGYSKQTITFNPPEVVFGDNSVYNDSGYKFYAFTAGVDGEYSFKTNDGKTSFNVFDYNLNSLSGKAGLYNLSRGQTYYIMQQNAQDIFYSVNLNISLDAEGVGLNQTQNFRFNEFGYINLMFNVPAEGYYLFTANCGIEIYASKDLTKLWSANESLRASMFDGRLYYIHLSGEPNAEISFNVTFDPDHIDLNTSQIVRTSPKWFTYISESDNEHSVYTFGSNFTKTEVVIYDGNLTELDRFNQSCHANFKFNFNYGQKYYIMVNLIDGPDAYGFMVEDLKTVKEYAAVTENSKYSTVGLFEFESKKVKFVPEKTNDFEIRLKVHITDNFELKLYNVNTGLFENYIKYGFVTDDIYILNRFTFSLVSGNEYYIILTALNDGFKNPLLSVVVPVKSAALTFNGMSFDDKKVINVRQGGAYKLEFYTNDGATLFEPKITFGNKTDGAFEWDGKYAVWLYVDLEAGVGNVMYLEIELDFIKLPVICFMIEYKYELKGETIADKTTGELTYNILKQSNDNNKIESLDYLTDLKIDITYMDGTPLKSLVYKANSLENFIFDISNLNYDKDIKITATLFFNQNGKSFILILENIHYYQPDYLSLSDIKWTKNVILVSLSASGVNNNNVSLTIPSNVKVLNIRGAKGYTYTGVRFTIQSGSTTLIMNLSDFSFTAQAKGKAISSGPLEINVAGTVAITGGEGDTNSAGSIGVSSSNLIISGLGNLSITGGRGGNGFGQAQIYEPSSGNYRDSDTGKSGGNGGDGISCSSLTIQIKGLLNVTGGAGGTGAISKDRQDVPGQAGQSTAGAQGYTGYYGGAGGNGGYALYANTIIIDKNSGIIKLTGGAGGQGGQGGKGGTGGRGGNGTGVTFGTGNQGAKGGKGGTGGKGGQGGNGGAGCNISSSIAGVTISTGTKGSGGSGGIGGSGGAGGSGGSGGILGGATGPAGAVGDAGDTGSSGGSGLGN